MSTHTIRNKAKPTPIVTLTPKFMAQVLAARPESANLVLGWFFESYRRLTGKKPTLDYDQKKVLSERAGADAREYWVSRYVSLTAELYRVRECFVMGFMQPTSADNMQEALVTAELFYDGLDLLIEREKVSSSKKK